VSVSKGEPGKGSKQSILKETISKEAISKEAIPKETISKQSISEQSISKEAISKQSISKESAKRQDSKQQGSKQLGAKQQGSTQKVPLAQRRKARSLVLQALYQWLIANAEPLEIESQFREENSGKIDWDYFHEVLFAIPKQASSLDQHIHPLLDRKPSALDPVERALLYLGTFELAHRPDVPYRVVINECVELAKIFGATESHKYVNGVLDKLARTLRPLEQANHKKQS